MASPEKVFELVQKMTANEKRHFEMHSNLQKNKEKKYKLLFSVFEDMKNEGYDKEFVLKQLGVSENVMRRQADYLFKCLLDSLRSGKEDSIRLQLEQSLLNVEILKDKGFFRLALKTLIKAEKQAREHHKYAILLMILSEKVNLIVELEEKDLLKEFNETYQAIDQTLEILQQETRFRQNNGYLVQVFKQDRELSNSEFEQQVAHIYDTTKSKGFPRQGSFYAQYYYYSIQAIIARMRRDYSEASIQQGKVVELWEAKEQKAIKNNNLQLYITQLANQINYNGLAGNIKEVEKVLVKLEALNPTGFDAKGEKLQNLYLFRQLLWLRERKYKESEALLPHLEEFLDEFKDKVNTSQKLSLCYNAGVTLVLREKYDEANHWFDKIYKLQRTSEQRQDIQRMVRIWELVIYYKLDSIEVLHSRHRSIKRNKTLKNSLKEVELKMLDFFKDLATNAHSSKKVQTSFKELDQYLDQMEDTQKRLFGYYELKHWVELQCNKTNQDEWVHKS